jgi:hypothetical protein
MTLKEHFMSGESSIRDENHAHKPGSNTSWLPPKELFTATRAEAVNLAQAFTSHNIGRKVLHNQFGPVSVLGWLRYLDTHGYLDTHAKLEAKHLR